MSGKEFVVIKAAGKKELFFEEKLRSSIERAQIAPELREQVVEHVKSILYQNIPTSEIYKHISEFLGKSSRLGARAKYSLKQAIMDLGPTGYPFEKFVAAVLTDHDYSTETNLHLKGKCVRHEVDIVAENEKERAMAEAKFHNRPGTRTDIKIALYTYARFQDLVDGGEKFNRPYLITNTKATGDAIEYGKCRGMRIISWSYPSGASLRDLIEETDLHPVTVLTSLSENELKNLLKNDIVLCRQVLELAKVELAQLGIKGNKVQELKDEAKAVCG